jgi:catechol 2,3-dioxygenase-like lactoylglutathione lyase family enzyme
MKYYLPFTIIAAAVALHAQDALPTPGFHHLHLNSTNPEAAIDFYVKQFPSTQKATFAGQPALKSGGVWVLFTKVSTPPVTKPQTAFWHFGWHVTDERADLKRFQETGVKLLPLYTGDGDASLKRKRKIFSRRTHRRDSPISAGRMDRPSNIRATCRLSASITSTCSRTIRFARSSGISNI